jgi:GntR family transcriptional regulator/MocR family aminotransferase
MVVTGSQQAIDLVSRVLVDRGDRIVMEDPFYPGAALAFSAVGAELIHSPVDVHGIDPAALGALGTVRLAYITPSHQFPSGAILPADRRVALLEWADRVDALVVEDDYDSGFRYDHPPIEAIKAMDRSGRVIYMGTVSKVMSPAVRLGYLVIPQHLVCAFAAAKWLVDRHSPTLEQEALADFIEDGSFERHLRRVRALHARKRDLLLEELDRRLPEELRIMGENAGIHLVAWLTETALRLTADVVQAAREREVGVYPVGPYYHVPPPEAGLLLGYSLPLDDIREGVRRLAAAITAVQHR